MSKLEEYKKSKSIAEQSLFYEAEKEKELPSEEGFDYKYDPDQLMEYYESRNESEEDFEKRTRYYFNDTVMANAKATRYSTLSGKNALMNKYAKMHSNRSARKRKNRASDAAKAFGDMEKKIRKYMNEKADTVTTYDHREEIMRLRMTGMIAAAKVKGKSDRHENYLKGRAKLSCLMILKDQLNHLIPKAENKKNRSRLNSRLKSLDKEIASAYKEIKELSVPNLKKAWEDTNKITGIRIDNAREDYKYRAKVFNKENSATLLRLQTMEKYVGSYEWPVCIYVTDKRKAPINYAEAQKRDWDNKYLEAQRKKDRVTLDRLEVEALKRFADMKLPSLKVLTGGNVNKVIEDNLITLYDLTKRALPYYKSLVGTATVVGKHISNSPYIMAKIAYLEAIDKYLDYELRVKGIEYKDGKYDVESSDEYRLHEDNRGHIVRNKLFGSDKQKAQLLGELGKTYKKFAGLKKTDVKEKFYVIPEIKDEDDDEISENPYADDLKEKEKEKKYVIPEIKDEDDDEISENPYADDLKEKEEKEEKKEDEKEEEEEDEKNYDFLTSKELDEYFSAMNKGKPFSRELLLKLAKNIDKMPDEMKDDLDAHNRLDDVMNYEQFIAIEDEWDEFINGIEEVEEKEVSDEEIAYVKELWGVSEEQIMKNAEDAKEEEVREDVKEEVKEEKNEEAVEEKAENKQQKKYTDMSDEEFGELMLKVLDKYDETKTVDKDILEEFKRRNEIDSDEMVYKIFESTIERNKESDKEDAEFMEKYGDLDAEELMRKLDAGELF